MIDTQALTRLVGELIDLAVELCDPYQWDVTVSDNRPGMVCLRLTYRLKGRSYGSQMLASIHMTGVRAYHLRKQVDASVRGIRKEIADNLPEGGG